MVLLPLLALCGPNRPSVLQRTVSTSGPQWIQTVASCWPQATNLDGYSRLSHRMRVGGLSCKSAGRRIGSWNVPSVYFRLSLEVLRLISDSNLGWATSVNSPRETELSKMDPMRAERRLRRRRLIALALLVEEEEEATRREQRPRPRLGWRGRVEQLLHEGEFKRTYRMSVDSFNTLCSLLVQLDRPAHAWVNRGPVSVANKLQMTIRFLAGGMIDDVRASGGVDRSYCYRIVKDVMRAIVAIPSLQIRFPMSPTEREQAAAGFAARSNEGVMNGCVAAMDGWLCNIQAPSDEEVGSAAGARRYFSGHYMHPGINVQAACDALSRFVFVEATHPGGINDSRAYADSGMPSVIEGLERGLYVVADAAYTATNHLLTPYIAMNPDEIYKDSFNFHLSQIRIRIEMAFGLLTKKWGIFHHPIQLRLATTTLVIKCAAILHNFTINERLEHCQDPVLQELRQAAREERRTIQSILSYEADPFIEDQTHSFVREGIVANLRRISLLRAN